MILRSGRRTWSKKRWNKNTKESKKRWNKKLNKKLKKQEDKWNKKLKAVQEELNSMKLITTKREMVDRFLDQLVGKYEEVYPTLKNFKNAYDRNLYSLLFFINSRSPNGRGFDRLYMENNIDWRTAELPLHFIPKINNMLKNICDTRNEQNHSKFSGFKTDSIEAIRGDLLTTIPGNYAVHQKTRKGLGEINNLLLSTDGSPTRPPVKNTAENSINGDKIAEDDNTEDKSNEEEIFFSDESSIDESSEEESSDEEIFSSDESSVDESFIN